MRFFQGCCLGGCLAMMLWFLLVIMALALIGCGSGVDITSPSEAKTPAQIEAFESSNRYAAMKGVYLAGVRITNDIPGDNYASWAVCNQPVIGFNAEYIERPEAFNRIHMMAAHEVCHLYYKDNMPCGLDTRGVEARAEACAAEMYNRG